MSERDGKTEKPSAKKLSDARKKGQIAKSQELSSSLTFTIFALVGVSLVTMTLQNVYPILIRMFTFDLSADSLENNMNQIGMQAILYFFMLAGPFLAVAFVAGIVVNIIQVGFYLSAEPMKPQFNRLNPVSGIKNMFSKKAFFQLLKNMAKLGLIFWMAASSANQVGYYALNASSVSSVYSFSRRMMNSVSIGQRRCAMAINYSVISILIAGLNICVFILPIIQNIRKKVKRFIVLKISIMSFPW